jgi:hypothetical protein
MSNLLKCKYLAESHTDGYWKMIYNDDKDYKKYFY